MKKGTILASVLSAVAGAAVGAGVVGKISGEAAVKTQDLSDKHLALYLMMNQWVKIKQEGKELKTYFEKNNYRKIAIYGMSYAGETLVSELKNSDIEIAYGIDRNAGSVCEAFEVVFPEDELEEVDAVIVTPITYYREIEAMLEEKLNCPIISLEDILYEV